MEVLQKRGPGGGWPEIRLTGPESEVAMVLETYFDMDASDMALAFSAKRD